MTGMSIGYARCSTQDQDVTAQRVALLDLGVAADRIYVDYADLRVMPTSGPNPLVAKAIGLERSA